MKREVFWKNPGYKGFPKLNEDIECDYLIVGGGVTGVSLAYFLAKEGKKKIVLIEKDVIASGATGKAAGTLAAHGELDLNETEEKHGKVNGAKYWKANLSALNLISKIIKDNKIDCDYEVIDEFFGGYKHKNQDDPLKEYIAEKEINKKSKLLVGDEIKKILNTDLFHHVLYNEHQGISVNPLKLTQNLSKKLDKKKVKIYEKSPLISFKDSVAKVSNSEIKFNKLIFCTDAGNPNEEVKKIKSTIIITRRLSQKELNLTKFSKSRLLVWDSKENYDYLKLTKDKRLLLGFGGINVNKKHKKTEPHLPHLEKIKRFMKRLFPYLNLSVEYAWSGSFGITREGYPLIERKGNILSISGTGSQVVSVMSAKYLSDRLSNKKSDLETFFKID